MTKEELICIMAAMLAGPGISMGQYDDISNSVKRAFKIYDMVRNVLDPAEVIEKK